MIKVKILIVDDEEDYCLIMKSYFEKKGHEVYVAFNLTDGLKMLEDKKPNILFLDNNLPDGEGWDQTEGISELYPDLQINLISAYKQKPTNFATFSNVKFWEKPLSIRSLDEVFSISA